jgi:hypothetical protein
VHGQARLTESVVRDLKADLRAHFKPSSDEWESLTDTLFDLDDPVEPVASGSQSD